jgi:NAD(P) transhydrogenase subunit alpha
MDTALLIAALYIFILAAFLGFQVISRVPPLLHTPLMSATNAISAISVVAAIIIAGSGHGPVVTVLGVIAVASAMCNVVGGFLITERILKMFKKGKAKD